MLTTLKPTLLLLFLCAALSTFAQPESRLVWKADRPIQWTDFEGPVDESSEFEANTNSGMNYQWHMDMHAGKMSFKFSVYGFMNKSKSWVRPGKQTDALLKHEQLHFDISEYFARQLLRSFQNYTYTANFRTEIDQLFQQMMQARKTMEETYDAQSNHSRNKIKQAEWELYVAGLLSNNPSLEDAVKNEPVAP